ncbi:MAG: hypothetical protein ACJ8AM_16810 [Gemmatimonadales bacterium]
MALAIAGCESSQSTSKRLAKEGKTALKEQAGVTVGAQNPDIKVTETAVLKDANGIAVVVALKNTSRRSQAQLPVGITIKDAAGEKIYANDVPGLDASLTSLALVRSGGEAIWIDNQILGNGAPKKVDVKVGRAKGPVPRSIPEITLSKVRFDKDVSGPFVTGVITNHSKVLQRRLTVFCVARKGGKIVAAGRAVVDKLAPAPTPKPIRFSVYFIGNPTGAKLSFSVPPVNLG